MRDTLCLSCFQAKDFSFRASSGTPPNTSPREFPDAFTPPGSPKSSQPATYPGDDKDTVLSLGGKILGQAMSELSEDYIAFQEKHTDYHWRLESFVSGRNSFGALTFGHEFYKGEHDDYTPPKKDFVRASDTIFKIFWLNSPTEVFVGQGMRNLRLGFETERRVLLLATKTFEDAVNPCPKYYRSGIKTISIEEKDPFENTKTLEGEVGWIEMERLEPVTKPENSLIDVVTQLHELGYTHNDLSADNVMQRKANDRLVLIDLEKAKPLRKEERDMDLNAAKQPQVEIEKRLPSGMRKLALEEECSHMPTSRTAV